MRSSKIVQKAGRVGMPPTVAQNTGCMTYGVLSNGQNVWCDRSYTFHNLSPELAAAGSRVYQGPVKVQTGMCFVCANISIETKSGDL